MIDAPGTRTLRYPRRLDEKMDGLADQITDPAAEARGVKTPMARFMRTGVATDGAIAPTKERLSRSERRLDLQEHEQ